MPKVSKNNPFTDTILEFKSSSFPVPVLMLSSNALNLIDTQLHTKISLAPEFFKNSPVVFDLSFLNEQDLSIDIEELTRVIQKAGLLPIGIRGGNEAQNNKALALRIPVYSQHHNVQSPNTTPKTPSQQEPVTAKESQTLLITQPVRSGQRVYSNGDLIILSQVSPGAEILAEGNIHVYNSLKGRVLAGVLGNTNARIFCSDSQAELISIAGNYKISEDLQAFYHNKPVQIYLQEHTLIIQDID